MRGNRRKERKRILQHKLLYKEGKEKSPQTLQSLKGCHGNTMNSFMSINSAH